MGFFLSLIIIVAIQMGVTALLQMFGVSPLYIDMIINLILAVIFTFWNYGRLFRNKKDILKDISFHTNVCIWYSILTAISALGILLY